MGWETARTMAEALEMAKDTAPPSPEITLMHIPPICMAEVTA
jgi:lactate racemase